MGYLINIYRKSNILRLGLKGIRTYCKLGTGFRVFDIRSLNFFFGSLHLCLVRIFMHWSHDPPLNQISGLAAQGINPTTGDAIGGYVVCILLVFYAEGLSKIFIRHGVEALTVTLNI